ncbi:ribonuclease P protein component [Saccharopolyspora erythraea]|uniref:ribonuclease P protein component n=1 Tax=Saccharopolyspora erythraea TaxID=1836 RepID=UPI0003267AF1|nr:ribonuclease P protein component [Saccharopolyspora erythraea]QRK90018.1 ribonuclease P protein component [Saccharopolyspora erythraea]
MLPAAARLTRSQEFRLVVRRGRRAGRSRLVVHALPPDAEARAELGATPDRHAGRPAHRAESPEADVHTAPTRDSSESTRVGFVVSKAVGSAVVRHRVARQLRHLMRDRIPALPAGTLVVVRALPPAAGAPSRDLGADLDAALRKLRLTGTRAEGAARPPTGFR